MATPRKPIRKYVEDAARRDVAPIMNVGSRGLRLTSGKGYTRINEEWRRRLIGKKKWAVYREMAESDPIVGGFLWNLQLFLGSVAWRYEPAKDDDDNEIEAAKPYAERIWQAMEDTEDRFGDAITEAIYIAARDGACPTELTFKLCRGRTGNPISESRYTDGWLTPRGFGYRPLETIEEYVWDHERDRPALWVQQPPPDYRRVEIPGAKIHNLRFRPYKHSPEGISLLSIAERHYYFKKTIEETEAIGMKRDLTGYPVVFVPPQMLSAGATDEHKASVADFWEMAQKIDRDGFEGLVFPAPKDRDGDTGFDIKLMASGGARQSSADTAIKRYETRILAALGAGFMLTGMDGIGARSLDESKVSTFLLCGNAIMGQIQEWLTGIANETLRLNGVPEELWGCFEHDDLRRQDAEEFAAYVERGVNSGALTLTDDVEAKYREKGDLDPKEQTATPIRELAAPTDMPAAPDAPAVDSVQDTALNGAQVTAAMEIVQSVAVGSIPRDTGVSMLVEFFTIDPARAERIMGSVGRAFVPAQPEPVGAPQQPGPTPA